MGYFGKALAITPIAPAAIDGIPAWEFMNSGSLGTYLAGSAIYVGDSTGAQTAVVIVAGTVGAQNTVVALTITDGGSGYGNGTGVGTSGGSGTGLTVNTTVTGNAITAVAINAAGSGYKSGDIITIPSGGGNATLRVDDVKSLLPGVGDAITFDDVQPGSILPVKVDYVLNTSSAGSFVAMRDET